MKKKQKRGNPITKLISLLPQRTLSRIMLTMIFKKKVDTSDEIYKEDFRRKPLKVNWDISGTIGYQIYEENNYSYKYGKHLDDPDATLVLPNINHVRRLVRGDKINFEMSRDHNKNVQVCLQDPLFMARFKEKNTNPMILTKMPLLSEIDPQMVFGTTLFNIPDYGDVTIDEIVPLFKKMLEESDKVSEDKYQEKLREQPLRVNWDIIGVRAFQIFEETRYEYKFGEHLDNPDVTLEVSNLEYAKILFQGDKIDLTKGKGPEDNFQLCAKVPMLLTEFKDPKMHWSTLTKLPFFKSFQKKEDGVKKREEDEYGAYIPINLSTGDYHNEVIPLKVFEHFINKASHIVMTHCYCRKHYECENHEIGLGCMYMGDDTKNMVLADYMKVATKEEALERVKLAVANGLIPLLGRSMGETEGQGIKDTGHFLSSCFCCTCCCINGKMISNATASNDYIYYRIKGLEINIDESKCVGCGECLEVCVFKGREVLDGKAHIDPKYCLGCGRCLSVCPNGAISLDIEDPSYIDELITKIESVVDVTSQKAVVGTND